MDLLQTFKENEPLRQALKEYLDNLLNEYALEMVYKGEDTVHLSHTKKVLDKLFNKLKVDVKERPTRRTNHSE